MLARLAAFSVVLSCVPMTAAIGEPSGGMGFAAGQVRLDKEADGHFWAEAKVNGRGVRFMIDTGATVVALSPADARKAGLDVSKLNYSASVNTANGVTKAAPVTLKEVRIRNLTVREVPAIVVKKGLNHSLLGMSFLSRLDSYGVADGQLTLKD